MSNTVTSTNMGMPVPVVGTDPGPDWASNLNACLSIVDGHTHTSGSGVPITPNAININADLPFNGNNATTLRTVRFSPQGTPLAGAADLGCLYEQGVDLYYIDGSGNQVRITQGGSVVGSSGTITGLPSGTASAAFAAGTFTFQSATNTPAAMNVGPVTLGQATNTSKNVTISCNGAQAANYNLTLPLALPASQSALVASAAGNLSFQFLTSGTFTPTATNISNTGANTPRAMNYIRIGNIVTCTGSIDMTGSSGLNSIFDITLPITPVFAFQYDCSGLGSTAGSSPQIVQIYADVGANQAQFAYVAASNSLSTISYSISYKVA